MEASAAARYLKPRPFVIALSAATATLGDLGSSAFPLLYALVADEVGLPHAVPFPSRRVVSTPSMRSFTDILRTIRAIPFLPNQNMAHQHGLHLPPARVRTVDHAVRVVLDMCLRTTEGLAHAIELMEPLIDPAMHGTYEPDGVISCFLRKVCVAFASLSMEALSRLLHDLRLFVHPDPASTISSYAARAFMPDAAVSRNAALQLAKGLPVASKEDFRACTKLYTDSREVTSATNLGVHALNQLGRDQRTQMALPAAEFVVHLEAQRRRDFSTSVDALHRYFDLSLSEIGRMTAEANGTARKDDLGPGMKDQKHEVEGHQYAALSLGILYANFGDTRSASVALDDTIRAAQHCGDEACQARALNWIARTSSSIAKRHQLLRHANDNLALAREELCTVFTPVSDDVPDSVGLQSFLVAGASEEDGKNKVLGNTPSARLSRIQNRLDYVKQGNRINCLLMSAAAWESHAACSTALTVAKMALRVAQRKYVSQLSIEKARAIAAVASLTALEGDWDKATSLLEDSLGKSNATTEDSEKSTNAPEIEVLSRCLVWLKYEQSLNRGDTGQASKYCAALSEVAECGKHNTVSFENETLMLDAVEAQCRLYLASRATKQAALEAENLCRQAATFGRPSRVVEGLRLRAEAYVLSSSYSSALPAALAAASLSQGLGLESAHVKSVLTLAEVILRMEEHEPVTSGTHAFNALKPVLAKALGGMGSLVRGRAYRLHAESLLAIASGYESSPGDEIVELVRESHKAYQDCENCVGMRDCSYLLARIHHWRGEVNERNASARRYRKASQDLAKRQPCLSVSRD